MLIFGSPFTLLSNTEPTFKKGALTPSRKVSEHTSSEFQGPSARPQIYSCYVPVGGGFLEVKNLDTDLEGGMVLDRCQGGHS